MNKILVIDNESAIVELIQEILSMQGFDVQIALNGQDGIKSCIKFKPDLILCDISMPEMSGYDVLEILRKDERTDAIPFIFLTAMGGMQDLRKGMLLGADDYLTKPVTADEIIAAVNTRLQKHQQITSRYQNEIEQTRYDLEITRNYDESTGLPKRSVLERRLRQYIGNLSSDHHIALFIVKFNRFKNITDIFGKNEYLSLIQEMSGRMEKACGSHKNTYSLDEGEFGLLLNDLSTKQNLTQLADKILFAIRKPLPLQNHELNCTASIGISTATAISDEAEEIISNAEIALNAAMESGFNTYNIFKPELKKLVLDQLNIESALHKALERGEFTIYYQPKFDSKDKTVIGSEALIRWENSDYGLLPPSQFVPIAEENGLIIPIGEWVLESICNQLNDWKTAGLNPAPVAINISARQLEQRGFVNSICAILEKSNIENELLEIELTESILIKNSQKTSNKLVKLRKKGMKVAIDDFGTGYSSLAYLSNFPFDKLKIDQSFIRDITTDKTAASLATSIISMAHGLGVRVIAEGVETEDQLNFLRDYECDEIQGFYFSKPITADEFTEMIKEQNITATA